ncbi:hypothetical protein EQV89_20495 [Salmonella enterica]|uniref:Uncharacterized protein n=1 Tax=Salmonella enterica TaxID=28901 RepID=A0A603L419_SALER|nr:hypothetical protein [Salmonella enterica]MJG47434.1 hypothetical protein [Salmonella enterica subsp. salamae]EAN9128125.1 hypothetical protein [Salmonella enterica]EAP9953657.1 hypothetical protein [Salmonella enterica]EAR7739640.1 hypothetical protein [Salmonella enterica]
MGHGCFPDAKSAIVYRICVGKACGYIGDRWSPGTGIRRILLCHRRKKAHPSGWASSLSDAWQFMAGVLPATLRAVAAQRSNPLPADLSYSGERSPTDYR